MSGKKAVEIVILVLLLLGVILMAVYCFWRKTASQINAAGAAAARMGRETSQSSQQEAKCSQQEVEGAEAMRQGLNEKSSFTESEGKVFAEPVREGRFAPSFRGRGTRGNPPCVGASQVEDDGPVPPDGGGMPSKELKPVQIQKGVCNPGGVDSDF